MSGQTIVPKITWGTSFANTLTLGYPLDNWASYSRPREGSEWVQARSGVEDAWMVGTDYYLEGDLRWIPTSPTTTPVSASGWDGSTGVRAYLEWARQKNVFRWYPDKNSGTYHTVYLVEPMNEAPSLEVDGTRRFRITMRTTSGSIDGY